MAKNTRLETRITDQDKELLEEATSILKEEKIKRGEKVSKYYGISSFMLESSINRAKRLIAQKSKK